MGFTHSMNISAYPSIYALGHKLIHNIFDGPVLVEEKIDGSQFSFTYISDGQQEACFAKSKGAQLDLSNNGDNCNKLFRPAVKTMLELAGKGLLRSNWIYRGEAVSSPKHNTLAYGRAPNGGLILFDVDDGLSNYLTRQHKEEEVAKLGLEIVPVLHEGIVPDWQELKSFLDKESILGGCKIEGFVVKNYNQFGLDKKILMGKFVSEAFKEKHNTEWKKSNPNKADMIENLITIYKHENRWKKAIQHLQEQGLLKGDPSDIGQLMKEISLDIYKEEADNIKQVLFDWGWKHISRGIVRGFPEWYKEELAKGAFNEANI